MHKKHKYDILILLSLIGLGVSVYLLAAESFGASLPCSITHGCNEVLGSRYSNIFGIPLPLWGIGFYVGVVFLSLMSNHYASWKKYLTILVSVGAAAALVFLYIQFFVLGKVCQYCLATDVLAVLLLLLDLNLEHKV